MLREQRQILNYRLYHRLTYYNILHYKILCYILPVITMFSELEDDLDWLLHVVVTDLPRNLSEKKENKNLWVRANPHGGGCCQFFSDPMEMATHSSIFVWRIPWTEEPDRLQPIRSQRVRHKGACTHPAPTLWGMYRYYFSFKVEEVKALEEMKTFKKSHIL